MEGMNMQIMDMIDQMMYMPKYLQTKDNGEAAEDRYGYPFEPVDAFSGEPLSFAETGMRLYFEAMELFNMAARANRRSPLFYKMSGQLEKLIGQLGSICITKAVLEQQGESFGMLDKLKISLLRSMTAFNFRKSWTSFMESRAMNGYNANALELSIRWAALDRRLIATDEKIRKIKAGEIKVDTLAKNTVSVNKKQSEKAPEKEEPARSFDPQARAFPLDKAALREMNEQTAEKQPEEVISAGPEISEGSLSHSQEIPATHGEGPAEKEEASASVFECADLHDADDDPEEEDDPDAGEADEDSSEVWPFPIRAEFLFTQDRDLYRIDRSSIPIALSMMGDNAPPG